MNIYYDSDTQCLRFIGNQLKNLKMNKKAKIRNQYNQVPHLTQETTWESDKTHKHYTQEKSPFPAGGHKAAMNRQESMTHTKHK